MYAINSKTSFQEVGIYRDQILRVKDKDYFPMVLVGNKSDLEEQRQVSTREALELAQSWNVPFIEAR